MDARLVEAQHEYDEGLRLKDDTKYTEAIPHIVRARELREVVLGPSHPDVANCLELLGSVYRRQGEFANARKLLERALALKEAALGRSHPDVGDALVTLANLYVNLGEYPLAKTSYDRALTIRETAFGKNHPQVATVLNNLGNLYTEQEQCELARNSYERAIALRRAAFGEDDLEAAQWTSNLANVQMFLGEYTSARAALEKSVVIQERRLGENHPDLAIALHGLATVLEQLGDYASAERLLIRAVELRERAVGSEDPRLAVITTSLADVYTERGSFSKAEPLYARAIALQEKQLGRDHPGLTQPLINLANLYLAQGDFSKAQSTYDRALTLTHEGYGENSLTMAIILNNLGNIDAIQGAYERAEQRYTQALTIRRALLGEKHPLSATTFLGLAELRSAQGRFSQAEALYLNAIQSLDASLGERHDKASDARLSLARLYLRRGDLGRAEPLYQRILSSQETGLGSQHPTIARTLNDFAKLRLSQGRLEDALALLERAFLVHEEHLRQEMFGFSEARLSRVLSLLRADEELLYGLVREHPENARLRRLALSVTLLRKGRSVGEMADMSRGIYHGLGETDRKAFDELRAVRTQLARWAFSQQDLESNNESSEKELMEKAEALEARLSRNSAPFRTSLALPMPARLVEQVSAHLDRDSVLVEFITYGDGARIASPDTAWSQKSGELRYLALMLFADGHTSAVDLGLAADIDQGALALHRALEGRSLSYLVQARSLHERVFRPLEAALGRHRRLFVSVDGQLALVPFAALYDGQRFLLDRFDITYLTSGKNLLRRPGDIPTSNSVVILADPDFGSAGLTEVRGASFQRSMPRFCPASLTAVPGARAEALAIQKLLPQARMLIGPDATKDSLLGLTSPGVLHIATHGFFDGEPGPGLAARGLGKSVGQNECQSRSDNPLLRAGLALATSSTHSPEDSLVTALEMAGLDLWGTQLVVLSACETGRGEVKLGQGVYGLQRALVVAGAQTVVTSLWRVDDQVTRQLMEGYYQNLLSGQGRVEALRSAMKTLRQRQPHPYFWASFIGIGQDTPLQGVVPRSGTFAHAAWRP
jgi:CHAT domain-containing protein/Tfp pilus assembly protein PilF